MSKQTCVFVVFFERLLGIAVAIGRRLVASLSTAVLGKYKDRK